jgi:amino acid adenylation domain-containing protein
LYESYSEGRESEIEELEVQYGDYAVWQREYLQGEVLEKQLGYWREQLGGALEVLELPTDRPRPAVRTSRGAVEGFEIGAELSGQLNALSRVEGVTMFMLLLAAWQVLLWRYTGEEEIVVGTPIAGRNRAEVEHLIGFFVNALALRTDLTGDPTFKELLGRVREVALGGYVHQDVPFEKLVEELQPERSLSYNPLFQVVFALENTPGGTLKLPGLKISGFDFETETAKFDLRLSLSELDHKLIGSMRYSTDLFDAATIQRMLKHFHALLQSIAENAERRISELALLSEAEAEELLAGQAFVEKSERQAECLHRLFEAQVARAPDAIAVVFEKERLTYGELNRRANQLAHRLRAMGVGPETLVGLCVERSLEMVVGLLATLKAGGAYVPLDTQYPPERLSFMINDARLSLLLTQEHLLANLPACAAQILSLDADGDMLARESVDNPVSETKADNLAYVIYTSGSTGRPKGVFVTHGNAARLFSETKDWFGFDARDVWTLFHSCAFDFSVWELWGALLYGGRLVVVPYLVSRSPEAFYELLVHERVTILNQTPSAFRQLMTADEALGRGSELCLRFVIFGGEALELKSLKPWFERHGDRYPQLVNMYGITETTVHVTYRRLSASDPDHARGSLIGGPIPDLRAYVLDRQMRPVPDMLPGELCVGGEGVARGYLNRADLSAERFVPDALSGQRGARLYRSGDLVRRLPGGDMEYLGRIDQQVKIRGYRIELGEIEVALGQHSSVREAIVIAREYTPGEKRLVCYLVLRDGVASAPGADELREFLSDRLPDYMMPSAFVLLERIPLTPHGKVDRRALPAPTQARPALERSYVAPRDELERALAAMWREILDIERIGINDNFFDLGGDSIRGAIFINRLQERLNQIVHVVVIFKTPTIAQLAAYLNQQYAAAVKKLSGNDAHIAGAEDVLHMLPATGIDSDTLAEVRSLIQSTPMRETGRRASEAEAKNPPAVFILSPPRSGTTLLRVMLAGHPRLFAPPELELLSFDTLRERSATFKGKDSFWLEGALRAIMEIKSCDAEEARRIMRSMEERGLTTKECYGQLQEWLGQRMLVDKTPSYALDRATLEKAERDFDNALYVHLARHPSGMIRSFEEARLDQIFFRYEHSYSRRELAELVWIISHQNIIEFLDHIPPERQHRIKFEDLLAQPESVMESLCRFLGLTLHADMLQPYKDKERRMTDGLHAESRMLGDVKFHGYGEIVASVGSEWREQEEEKRAPLSEITWEVAGRLGYERERRARAPVASKTMEIPSLTKSGATEFPLSYAQERLWFLDQMEGESSATYNIATAVRLHGALYVTALKRSLDEVYERHSSLRTSFRTIDGEAVQHIALPQSLNMPLVDLSALTEAEREAEARRLATEEARQPFNLAQGPMLRAALIRLNDAEHVLLVTMHHIVSDGWSMGVLVREVAALYEAFSKGKSSPLPELPVQYADYAVWQREWLQGEVLETELAYWRKQLGGAAQVLELPTDRPRPPVQSFRGAAEPVIISAKVSESLKQLSRREGVTMFMLLLAAWQVLLWRYTREEEIVVGTPVAGRNRAEVEHLIGFFVNTLVLRADLSGNPKFLGALRRVQEMVIGAFAHQDVPFEKLVEELQPERSLSHTPLFQVMFALQNAPAADVNLHGLTLSPLDVDAGTAKVDLALTLFETDDGIMGSLSYATDLYEARTIRRIASHFKK